MKYRLIHGLILYPFKTPYLYKTCGSNECVGPPQAMSYGISLGSKIPIIEHHLGTHCSIFMFALALKLFYEAIQVQRDHQFVITQWSL